MARTATTRAGDYTGTQKAKLAEEKKEEQQAAAASMALATAAQEAADQEPVDLTPKTNPFEYVEKTPEDAVEITDVEVSEKIVKFRVNENLENVTIGVGNHYDFEVGRDYKGPVSIYEHLDERGLIWH